VTRVRDRHMIGGAAAACAVCCATPLIGLLGVAGFAATAVTLAFAGVVFAAVVGIVAVTAVLVRRSRARRGGCTVPEPTEPAAVDLGPTRTGDTSRVRTSAL